MILAFKQPPLYGKLISRFNSKKLPTVDILSNILFSDYSIAKNAKITAAKCFIENATDLGLFSNEFFNIDAAYTPYTPTAASTMSSTDKENTLDTPFMEEASNSDNKASAFDMNSGYKFEIPTLSKKTATMFLPDDLTVTDLDYIKLYVENMLPVFLDNLKSEITKSE